MVDIADLDTLIAHYGQTNVWYADGDIYPPNDPVPGDGVIDIDDLIEFLNQYGDICR